MANWLQKILPPTPPTAPGSRNVPSPIWQNRRSTAKPLAGLPNASIIYGMASAVLFVLALYLMFFKHHWIGGFLLFLPAGGLMGFALHFLKFSR